MEKDKIKLLINNKPKEYDLLYTFDSDVTDNSYLVCTDNTLTRGGRLKIYAFIYYPNDK
jgi:CTP:phosphocholine cytidylyltransferase-like protein